MILGEQTTCQTPENLIIGSPEQVQAAPPQRTILGCRFLLLVPGLVDKTSLMCLYLSHCGSLRVFSEKKALFFPPKRSRREKLGGSGAVQCQPWRHQVTDGKHFWSTFHLRVQIGEQASGFKYTFITVALKLNLYSLCPLSFSPMIVMQPPL